MLINNSNVEPTASRKTKDKKVKLEEFTPISMIGKGAFGKVILAERDNMKYAMKFIRKDTVIELGKIEMVFNEKMILSKANHPFLVGLEFCFQTETHIILVTKFIMGGDFSNFKYTYQL